MAVRNKVLCRARFNPGKAGLLGVVPQNTVWIVKSVLIYGFISAAQTVRIYCTAAGSAPFGYLYKGEIQVDTPVVLELWTVLNSQDEIYFDHPADVVDVWISGAELPVSQP